MYDSIQMATQLITLLAKREQRNNKLPRLDIIQRQFHRLIIMVDEYGILEPETGSILVVIFLMRQVFSNLMNILVITLLATRSVPDRAQT